MGAAKIRRDDEVVVISGKDRGKTGTVLRVDPAKSRVYVGGLNIVKRHQRPSQVQGSTRPDAAGGVIETRPMSALKRWRLTEVLERAK